jgi:hypothetical protein
MTDGNGRSRNSLLRSFFLTGLRLLGHFVAGAFVVSLWMNSVPGYFNIFEDYKLTLPAATMLLSDISPLVVGYWHLLGFFGLVFDGVVMFALSRLPSKVRWLTEAWSGALLIAAVVFMGFIFLSVSLPLESMPPLAAAPADDAQVERDAPGGNP